MQNGFVDVFDEEFIEMKRFVIHITKKPNNKSDAVITNDNNSEWIQNELENIIRLADDKEMKRFAISHSISFKKRYWMLDSILEIKIWKVEIVDWSRPICKTSKSMK